MMANIRMKTAEYWHKSDDGRVECGLCPHHCRIAENKTGLCGVRAVRNGSLIAEGYGHISSAGMDPMEKKPLYHFHPGSMIFSIGGWGCNLACEFCQNWNISQRVETTGERYTPEEIVEKALTTGSIGIAYTYNEPIIGIEFVQDCARLARGKGLVNVLVTNGFIDSVPASALLPLIDALNIDIKSMDDDFYRKRCRARLAPVLAFSSQAVKQGCHVEITNLLIPTLNDGDIHIRELAVWIRDNLGKATPLHLSAYRPEYKMDISVTPLEVLERAYKICSSRLAYVYMGNVRTEKGQNTLCPECGNVLIVRQGYAVKVVGEKDGLCVKCGNKPGITRLSQVHRQPKALFQGPC